MRQVKAFIGFARRLGTTEGCSFVPDFDFVECCEAHDKHYEEHDVLREEADNELYECINAKGHPWLAWVYWFFVRVFGQSAWESRDGTD